jgi:hypothetical protein
MIEPGTWVLLYYGGEWYPRFFVGYNMDEKPVIQSTDGYYVTVKHGRLKRKVR